MAANMPSIFRGMEVKVDLINTRDRLLAFLDQEMSDPSRTTSGTAVW
ncbi:hypothetical protein ABFY58_28865 [Enterobacter soli]